MRAFTCRRFWIALRYRLGVLCVCLAYVLSALEVPLPVFVHKNSSQPFPCQDHLCGCQTAEQCWSHCCCFTPEERWAWARAHNVEPPAYAEKPADKPAAQGWNTVKLRDRDTTAKSCCCGHKPDTQASEEHLPADATGLRLATIGVWRCQGYSSLWISAGAVLPVAGLAAWSPEDVPPVRVCLPSIHADMVPSTPPDPPPRLSLA
jgi:hypothetical protein